MIIASTEIPEASITKAKLKCFIVYISFPFYFDLMTLEID